MTLPAAIRRARLAAGLTQEGLARELGTTTSTIHRWESGAMTPSSIAEAAIIAWMARVGRPDPPDGPRARTPTTEDPSS